VCNYLLRLCKQYEQLMSERKLINSQTKDGNTVLMWAAWSQSLDVVKLLVRSRADTSTCNRNGCSVAHWAASGGSLAVCKYLKEIANVDFSAENFAGNTPLSHAVAYGRVDVVRWLREELKVEDNDGSAQNLAMDFVNWVDSGFGLGEEKDSERRKVFDLFQEWTYETGQ
jgi:ankyrin repeat protein